MLEGELEFMVNGRIIPAIAGSVIYIPRDNLHTFKNVGTTPSRILIIATPAGMEKLFEEAREPATDSSSPPPLGQAEIEKILATAPEVRRRDTASARRVTDRDREGAWTPSVPSLLWCDVGAASLYRSGRLLQAARVPTP